MYIFWIDSYLNNSRVNKVCFSGILCILKFSYVRVDSLGICSKKKRMDELRDGSSFVGCLTFALSWRKLYSTRYIHYVCNYTHFEFRFYVGHIIVRVGSKTSQQALCEFIWAKYVNL